MKRVGNCKRCGECCITEKDWSIFLQEFDAEKIVTPACPFLQGEVGDVERLCNIYQTHHDFWERHCSSIPSNEMDWQDVLGFFNNCPNCSFEYIEE